MRREGIGGRAWREDVGEVKGNRAGSYLDLLPSAACKCQEKSSKYHQDKKQTGNQDICEMRNPLCFGGYYVLDQKRRNDPS